MKRFFLVACLVGLLPVSSLHAQAPTPAAESMPAATGPTIPAPAYEPYVEDTSSDKSKWYGWLWKRTKPATAHDLNYTNVGCGGSVSTRECWDKFRGWICFRGTMGCYLPCFTPTPYRPPLYNWFPVAEGCAMGCAQGCGAGGCGGPPITYYYPDKAHPAPNQPRIELRRPQPANPNAATALPVQPTENSTSSKLSGFRFARTEIPGVPDKKPGLTMAKPNTSTSAKPNFVKPVSYNYEAQP